MTRENVTNQILGNWLKFRRPLGLPLREENITMVFGKDGFNRYKVLVKELQKNLKQLHPPTSESEKKFRYFHQELLPGLLNIPFIKFVAVTGSVATGNAKEIDDIDLFIIVRNHTAWIFRILTYLILTGRALKMKKKSPLNRAKLDTNANILCLNYIIEERALSFPEHDMFTFNEILQMIPVYNENYYEQIIVANPWIFTDYFLVDPPSHGRNSLRDIVMNSPGNSLEAIPQPFSAAGMHLGPVNRTSLINITNIFFACINLVCFLVQLAFMTIMLHKPKYGRLWCNFKRGTIEFWPMDFKHSVITDSDSS